MRNLFFGGILTLAVGVMLTACGHISSEADQYAETIFWTEETLAYEDPGPGHDHDEELPDSILEAQESEESDVAAADTQPSPDPATSIASVAEEEVYAPESRIRLRHIGKLHEIFNDSNHFQLEHARRLGIEPLADLYSYYNTKRPLIKIESNPDFAVDELRHSYPYLVPEAVRLLHDIGRNFQDSLRSRKAGKYRIIVTSVLRTPSTVRRLRRVNGNATRESTHQFGTTFDITYTRFDPIGGREVNSQGDLKNLLAEVLYDLRRQGRCMVKYERKSPCFHITVAK